MSLPARRDLWNNVKVLAMQRRVDPFIQVVPEEGGVAQDPPRRALGSTFSVDTQQSSLKRKGFRT